MATPEPGTILAGKFRIDRILGQGGMGVVVAAHHIQLDEQVAIKFLLPEALESKEAVARFEREARAAVKIKSEHIARVSDVGTLDNGAPYMVMEYLQGRDLSAVLEEGGPLPDEAAADYVLQACEALAEAHAIGIVHRDLKPPNLFLINRADGSPCVKVLDFGISKVTGPKGSSGAQGMTSTGLVMGSPLYMSPEQLASAKDVDMRTDIWALGVIMYELLTGQLPFSGESIGQLCTSILTAAPPPLETHRPGLPKGIEEVIFACLEKDRAKRTPSIADFAMGLVPFAPKSARLSAERIERVARAAGFGASVVQVPAVTNSEAPPPRQPSPTAQTNMGFVRTGAKPASNKFLIVGGAGVAALAILGVVVASHREPPPPAPAASTGIQQPARPAEPPPPPVVAPAAAPAPPKIEPAAASAAPPPSATPAPAAAPAPQPQKTAKRATHAAPSAPSPAAHAPAPAPAPAPAAPRAPANSLGGRM